MPLQPLDDRVVVEIDTAEATTKGGIFLPETAKEKPQRGKIIAVGNGKLLTNGKRAVCSLGTGDRVIFGKYSGTEVKYNDIEYKILKETDILAKLG